jgi:hypothetical protein
MGINLKGAVLASVNLQKARLHGADLREIWLWNNNLQGADLSNCSLQEAVLKRAKLQWAVFTGAEFRHTPFTAKCLGRGVGEEMRGDWKAAQDVYLALRDNFLPLRQYADIRWASVRHRRMARRAGRPWRLVQPLAKGGLGWLGKWWLGLRDPRATASWLGTGCRTSSPSNSPTSGESCCAWPRQRSSSWPSSIFWRTTSAAGPHWGSPLISLAISCSAPGAWPP